MPADSQLEVSVGLTQAILETLRTLHVAEPECLLQQAGIDPQLLAKPENRIPLDQQQLLWQLASERSKSAAFGLHFARCMQPTSFGVLGYMAMNCHTIDECFDAVVKYQFLAGQGGEFTLERDLHQVSLCYTPVNPEHPATAQRVLAMLAANVSFGRWLVGEDFRVMRVQLVQQQPVSGTECAEYEEFFACPVEFDSANNRLVYDAAVMQLAVPNASEELLQLLQERANRLLEGMSQGSGIAARITSLLATQLTNTVPDRARIAAQIGMSERTLQRRLAEEGTSFQEILENTRHYLARELLRNTRLSLNEVAMRLGFAEPSAFFRAFKKWQGCTPGQYRAA